MYIQVDEMSHAPCLAYTSLNLTNHSEDACVMVCGLAQNADDAVQSVLVHVWPSRYQQCHHNVPGQAVVRGRGDGGGASVSGRCDW